MTSGSGNRAAALYRINAARWTKKDVRTLCGQLDSFVLSHERHQPPDAIRAAIEANRPEIVIGGLLGFRALLDERQNGHTGNLATIEAWKRLGSAEVVARFERLSIETLADIAKIDALIARVRAEGLPPEASSYVPDRIGKRPT